MNLFDPARGDPRKLFWNGKSVGVVPGFYVDPTADPNDLTIAVCVTIAPSTGRWLHLPDSMSAEAFGEMLGAFKLDPETVLKEAFGWRYNEAAGAKPQTLTLADLGAL